MLCADDRAVDVAGLIGGAEVEGDAGPLVRLHPPARTTSAPAHSASVFRGVRTSSRHRTSISIEAQGARER
jgi:hypothetical protein